MPKIFFFVFLLNCAGKLFAQEGDVQYPAHAKQLIESVLNGADRPVVVAAKLDSFTVEAIKEALSVDSFFHRSSHDNWRTTTVDTFAFSEAERQHTDSCIEGLYNFTWTKALLPGSTILDQGGIDALMAAGSDMPAYIKSHFKADKFYWLASPIFLRNYTYSIFYYETNNGKPGGDQQTLAIYVLADKNWQRLMKIKIGTGE